MCWITDQTGITSFDVQEFRDAYTTRQVSTPKMLSIGNSAAYNYLKKNSSSSSLIPVPWWHAAFALWTKLQNHVTFTAHSPKSTWKIHLVLGFGTNSAQVHWKVCDPFEHSWDQVTVLHHTLWLKQRDLIAVWSFDQDALGELWVCTLSYKLSSKLRDCSLPEREQMEHLPSPGFQKGLTWLWWQGPDSQPDHYQHETARSMPAVQFKPSFPPSVLVCNLKQPFSWQNGFLLAQTEQANTPEEDTSHSFML